MKGRQNQRDRILALLKERAGQWVPLYEITALAAQYNSRVLELRREGHRIENKTEHVDGRVRSWFRLVPPETQRPLFNERELRAASSRPPEQVAYTD